MQFIRIVRILALILSLVLIWLVKDILFFPSKSMQDDPFIFRLLEGIFIVVCIVLLLYPYQCINKQFRGIFLICLTSISILLTVILIWLSIDRALSSVKDSFKGVGLCLFCIAIIISNVWAFWQITKRQ